MAAKATRNSADVGRRRERGRQRRLAVVLAILTTVFVWQLLFVMGKAPSGGEALLWLLSPLFSVDPFLLIIIVFFAVMLLAMVGSQVFAGRSPHVLFRPDQIPVTLDDVKGIGPIKEDVERSIDLFLAGASFRKNMGGTPRRGILFEGSPGTGKTLMAKAMASEAGVPFLFVSGTSFQSMWYGATARKIRSYFKALRKAARKEGAAIGFIEEIDAIATARGGMGSVAAPPLPSSSLSMCCGGLEGLPGATLSSPVQAGATIVNHNAMSEGTGGVVNELLVQMQSFDEPTGWQKAAGVVIDRVNLFLPAHRQIPRPRTEPVDILLIAATNRADSLDPALLRPGRFDRKLTFDLPDKAGRKEIIEYYLGKKSHEPGLADAEHVDALAGVTQGYSPVMIENLLDEGLVNAVRRDAEMMSWKDIEHARMVIEIGLGHPVGYTEHEKRVIATHEAGHATVAYLEAPERRLEILTIIKRASALGLLAHGDAEDVYTRSKKELTALIRIAFGGQVAEELFFGDITTGPASDLAFATKTGAQMIGSAGMTDTLISFTAIQGSAFSPEDLVARVLGDGQTRFLLEELLNNQKNHVRDLMQKNRHLVEALRDALLERHELIGHEITDVLKAAQAAHDGGATEKPAKPLVIDLRGFQPNEVTPKV